MLVAIACLLSLCSEPPAPVALPQQTKDGITCSVRSLDLRTVVSWETDTKRPTVSRSIELAASAKGGETPFVEAAFDIVEAAGPDGRNWLATTKPSRRDMRLDRQTLRGRFSSQIADGRESSAELRFRETLRSSGDLPGEWSRVRAWADLIVAGQTSYSPVEAGNLNEPIQIAPGVTFLLTKFAREGPTQRIDFEVRIQRPQDAQPGRYEPIFAGVRIREKDGKTGSMFQFGQEFETRDEYILVSKGLTLDPGTFAPGRTLEAVVFSDIHTVRFEIGADHVPLAVPPSKDKVAPEAP